KYCYMGNILVIANIMYVEIFFFSSRRRHTRSKRDWSSDVCSSDLEVTVEITPEMDMPRILEEVRRETDGIPKEDLVKVVLTGKKIGRASCRERVWKKESGGW